MTDTAGTAIAVLVALGAAGALLYYVIAVLLPALDAPIPLVPSETAVIALGVARRPRAAVAGRPHDLHTGCAAPAPHPALLGTSTGPVATEGKHHSAAAGAADATARPGRNAVA